MGLVQFPSTLDVNDHVCWMFNREIKHYFANGLNFAVCGSYCIHNFEIVSLRQVILLGFQEICKWKMAVFGTEQALANKQSAYLNMVLCPVSVITLYLHKGMIE